MEFVLFVVKVKAPVRMNSSFHICSALLLVGAEVKPSIALACA
jgi:hypothetical protein